MSAGSATVLSLLLASAAQAEPLTLEEAIRIASEQAESVIQAREDVVLVDAEWLQARSAILPRLDLALTAGEVFAGRPIIEARFPNAPQLALPGALPVFTYGPFVDGQANSYSNPRFSVDLRGRQLLFDGGRWWTVLARVKDVEVARRAALRAATADLTMRVTQAFYDLAKARQAVSVLDLQVSRAEAQLGRAQALVAAGLGKVSDVATVAGGLAEDRIGARRQRLAEGRARRTLKLELGRAPKVPVELALPELGGGASEALDLDALVAMALERRPELERARAEIESAKKDVGIEDAARWPVLALGASWSRSSRRPDRVFGDPTQNYFAGLDLNVQWNLFEGRATDARVQAAEINLRKIITRYQALGRQTAAEVEDAFELLEAQRDVLELTERALEAAAEAVRLARGLFEQGRGTALELRDAELRYTRAELGARDARFDVEVAKAALARAAGASLEETAAR